MLHFASAFLLAAAIAGGALVSSACSLIGEHSAREEASRATATPGTPEDLRELWLAILDGVHRGDDHAVEASLRDFALDRESLAAYGRGGIPQPILVDLDRAAAPWRWADGADALVVMRDFNGIFVDPRADYDPPLFPLVCVGEHPGCIWYMAEEFIPDGLRPMTVFLRDRGEEHWIAIEGFFWDGTSWRNLGTESSFPLDGEAQCNAPEDVIPTLMGEAISK